MDQPDRRRAPRIPRMIEILFQSDSPPMTARLTDISEQGLFVDVPNPLSAGSRVTLRFRLTSAPEETPLVVEGKVAWHQQTVGMGVEFVQLSDEDRARIRAWIASQT